MLTTIVIGTTGYSSDGTAYSGFAGAGGTKAWGPSGLFGLKLMLSDEGYGTAEFNVIACGPAIPFPPGLPVQVVTSNDDGSSPVLRFTGDLQNCQLQYSQQGPAWGLYCTDLKKRGDSITLISDNGTGIAQYNLSPTDPLYLFNLAGRTVGQILTDLLTSNGNATSLSAAGIGQYTFSGGAWHLPSLTVSDLALLTIVPPTPVNLQGESIFNVIEQFVQQWHAQYTLYIQPDGTIRIVSIFGRTSHSLTQPGGTLASSDPIFDLTYKPDVSNCYTAVQILGLDIAGTTLSVVDGTLIQAESGTGWTSASYLMPNDASDEGAASSVTSSSCTVHSDHSTVHWASNYWNTFGGVIELYNLVAVGVAITEVRQVTSCTAMTAGGTATITWDSSLPLDSTSYSRYRLRATNTPLSLFDRKFFVREPGSGNTGTNTYIGSHMYPVFPYGYPWANLGKGGGSISVITQPSAVVLWSSSGNYPWFASTVGVDLDPADGSIVLKQPAVFTSAGYAGQMGSLQGGYPANTFMGLWHDIQVAIPYNRGDISTRSPTSGFSGTAFTKYGIEQVKTLYLPNYIWKGDSPALNALAAEHLKVVQDAVIDGSVKIHYDAWTPTFDVLTLAYAISVATPGGTSEIDGIDLPVRSVLMEWPDQGPDIHLVTFTFSSRHRAFEGDALYTHPAFDPRGWGMQGDQLFTAGQSGIGYFGGNDFEEGAAGVPSGGNSPSGPLPPAKAMQQTPADTRRQRRLEDQRERTRQVKADRARQHEVSPDVAKLDPSGGNRLSGPAENPDVGRPINPDASPQPPRRLTLRERRNDTNDEDGGG